MAERETQKRLALAITDFLSTSLKDGSVDPADKDSIEIAQSCISEAFHIDATDKSAMDAAIGNQNLLQIYSVYDKLKGTSAPSAKAPSAGASTSSTTGGAGANASGTSAESEKFKSAGNEAMKSKNYTTAIESYSKALNFFPLNPVYLSNRAAAYSGAGQHAQASTDAEVAVANDPSFTKAWSRLGYARLGLGDAKGSVEAYEKGIEYEGNGGSEIMKKALAAAKQKLAAQEAEGKDDDEEEDAVEGTARGTGGQAGGMPDLSALAGMFGGGGGGGGGGMPDLSSIMSNPMFAGMAQKMMQDPSALQGLMNNPQLRDMASKFGGGGGGGAGQGGSGAQGGGGGGMPDLASMMKDPAIADMAKKFMGGQGGGA